MEQLSSLSLSGSSANSCCTAKVPWMHYTHAQLSPVIPRLGAACACACVRVRMYFDLPAEMAWQISIKIAVVLLCFLTVSFCPTLCTGKKLQDTLTFDIKPSGQLTHQTLKLVS